MSPRRYMVSASGWPLASASSWSARYRPTWRCASLLAATVCAMPVPIFTAVSAVWRICFLESSCAGLSPAGDAVEVRGPSSLDGSANSSHSAESDAPASAASVTRCRLSAGSGWLWPLKNRLGLLFWLRGPGIGLSGLRASRSTALLLSIGSHLSDPVGVVAVVGGGRLDGVGRLGRGRLGRDARGPDRVRTPVGRARPLPADPAGRRDRLGDVPVPTGSADSDASLCFRGHG